MDRDVEFSDRNDSRLIEAIFGGEVAQYHDLMRPYERGVFRMAFALMQNEADAEAVAQQVFLKALGSLSEARGRVKFRTLLISITLNEARSRLRQKAIVGVEALDGAAEEGGQLSPALLQDWCEIPSSALERLDIRTMLQQAIAGLSNRDREVFILRDMEEFSEEETAVALTISPGTVKVRLHRARMMMQRELAPKLRKATRFKPVEQATSTIIGT